MYIALLRFAVRRLDKMWRIRLINQAEGQICTVLRIRTSRVEICEILFN